MIYNQTWLEKLRRRFGRFGIPNLMLIIVGAMAIVFVMDFAVMAASGRSLSSVLAFDRAMIFRGQVWRIFTFLFIPPSSSLLFAAADAVFLLADRVDIGESVGELRVYAVLSARCCRGDSVRVHFGVRY